MARAHPKTIAVDAIGSPRFSMIVSTEGAGGQAIAADPDQPGDVAGDQDHGELAIGELAIATAAIVAQVIAAAGRKPFTRPAGNGAKN